jgi:hypothetical protein
MILTVVVALTWTAPAIAAQTIFDPGEPVWHAETVDSTLDTLAYLGTDVVRLRVAYADPADFTALDRVVAGTYARGMTVLLTPVGPAPSVSAYADFVGALGRRYPQVHLWAIYNEPDLPNAFPLPGQGGWNLGPGESSTLVEVGVLGDELPGGVQVSGGSEAPNSEPNKEWTQQSLGAAYRETFLAAQAALVDSGHGRREALVGETHPGVSMVFVRAVLDGARIVAGGWAQHPYITTKRPWFTSGGIGPADLPRLRRTLVAAARRGETAGALPVYVTEFGPNGAGRDETAMLAASEWVMTRWRWVRSFAQYTLFDDSFGTGLYSTAGAPKFAAAFRRPLFAVRKGHLTWVWGHLRAEKGPAVVRVTVHGRFQRRVKVGANAGGYYHFTLPWRDGQRFQVVGGGPAERAYRLENRD